MPVSVPELVRNRFSPFDIGGIRSDAIPGAFAEFPAKPADSPADRSPGGETRHVILQAAPAIAGAPSRRGPILIPGLPALGAERGAATRVPGGGNPHPRPRRRAMS